MFAGMLKKFFWGMVFSGFTMALIQISPFRERANQAMLTQIKVLQQMARNRQGRPANPQVELPPGVEIVEYQAKAPPPTPQPATHTIDGKEYVLIQGKYYEYRADHIYMVDGQKVFFRKDTKPAVDATHAASDGAPLGTIPLTPADFMKALQGASKTMADREKFLDNPQ